MWILVSAYPFTGPGVWDKPTSLSSNCLSEKMGVKLPALLHMNLNFVITNDKKWEWKCLEGLKAIHQGG